MSNVTALPTQPEQRAGRAGRLVADRDQLRLGARALRDAANAPMPRGLDLRAAHHLDLHAGDRPRPRGERGRRQRVRRRVAEVARAVGAPRRRRGRARRPRATSWWAETISASGRVVLARLGLERRRSGRRRAASPRRARRRRRRRTLCGSSQHSVRVAQLARAAERDRRRDRARSASKSSRLAEPDRIQRRPAACVCASERKLRARLAGLDERAERAVVDVVRDPLAVEDADDHGVGARVGRAVGSGPDVHRRRLSSDPCPRP